MIGISIEGKKRILIAVIFIAMGLIIGFYAGSYITIKSVVSIGSGFLDEELVEQAIFQYKNHIKSCYPAVINLSI